jgi:hypothetical protein
MAHTDPISDQCLNVLAADIGQHIGSALPPSNRPQQIQLAENLRVCFLTAEEVTSAANTGKDLRMVAQETNRFHHQIRFDSRAVAYARSVQTTTPQGKLTWSVREFAVAPLAEDIEQALLIAEPRLLEESTLVRLLAVPAYGVHALWLINQRHRDQVVLVDTPSRFRWLTAFQIVESPEFLAALSKETQVVGIHLTP